MRSDYPCSYMRDDQRCCNQAIDDNSNAMRMRKKEFIANSPFENIRNQGGYTVSNWDGLRRKGEEG